MNRDLSKLEKKIGYKFKNPELLRTALTHSSYANENRCKSYERLEFLGDSLLGFITADFLFNNYKFPEGDLTKMRAALVREETLCIFSRDIGVGEFMNLSNGEIHTGGKDRPSILADMFESITAAIYLDSGSIEETRKFVLSYIEPASKTVKTKAPKDYKTTLQEIVQQNPEEQIKYVVVSETGPDHNKHFVVEVHLNSNVIGKGGGRSKKLAEQQAAREALELMGY